MRSSGAAVEGGGGRGTQMGHGAALEARQLVVSVGVGCGGDGMNATAVTPGFSKKGGMGSTSHWN